MARLVHIGSVIVDIVMYVPGFPRPGGDVLATRSEITPGGGLNVMISARRQGAAVAYAGLTGTGPFGELCRQELEKAGIELLQPAFLGEDTGYDVALVDPAGERTFATNLGAESRLDTEHLERIVPASEDVVYVSGYGLLDVHNGRALAHWLTKLDPAVTVVVDPGPLVGDIPADALRAAIARTDWWSCSRREATVMTGLADPARAARALAGRGRGGVVVRVGPDGCFLAQAREVVPVPGHSVSTVDTNGAGDAHVGAFVAGLLAGHEPLPALARANAVAALAVTRCGPATAPTAAEVDEFLTRT
ncbi:PfkB family carbohydrate kinase [Fodinicola acaciae]|uniref:PfkB family carbohydrate kinase n=1 Tax=Fodinicola acaciae TaxID=2681555 RepID=UPI001C9E9FEC|nr:PfkB family carbohydrate kinase [Fodinicola acaciae]